MSNADRIEIESDERGFELHVWVDEEPRVSDDGLMVLNIQSIDLDTFYDQVKGRIGPYLREKEEAFAEFRQAVKYGTGPAAPFLCAVEDIDESGGYDRSDPKHPEFHSVHADIWDARAGK